MARSRRPVPPRHTDVDVAAEVRQPEGWRNVPHEGTVLPSPPPVLVEASSDPTAFYDHAPAALLTLDRRGCVVRANHAAAALLGMTPTALSGWPLVVLVARPHIKRFVSLLRQVQAGGSHRAELRLRGKAGPGRDVMLVAESFPFSTSLPLIGVFLTDRLPRADPADLALEAQVLWREVVARWQEAVFMVTEDGTILSINAAAEHLLGHPAAEMVGRSCGLLVASRLRPRQAWQQLRQGGEHSLRHGNGTTIRVDVQVTRSQTSRHAIYVLVVRDLNERLRLERESLEIGERERRRIGQDLHDSIIQVLAGAAFMARQLEQRLRRHDAARANEADRIATLLQQMIGDTRSMSHHLYPVELEHNGLAWALKQLGETTQAMYGVQCRVQCRADVSGLHTDTSTHLFRIAQEAVSNAVRHGHAKTIQVKVSQRVQGGTLMVEDDGVGLGPDGPSHTGMGIDNMQRRAHLLGGSLRLAPRPGGGTRVVCRFRPQRTDGV